MISALQLTSRPTMDCAEGRGTASTVGVGGVSLSGLDLALRYERDLHWSLLPTRSKEPAADVLKHVHGSTGWRRFREQPATEEDIRAWFAVDAEVEVAAITGIPSMIVVADIDQILLAPTELLNAPTALAWTPRPGNHVFLRIDAESSFSSRSRLAWGDLKGESGYVVLPTGGTSRRWIFSPFEVELAAASQYQELLTSPSTQTRSTPTKSRRTPKENHSPEKISSLEKMSEDDHAWRSDETVNRWLADQIGIPFSGKFSCVLPGHGPDTKGSAEIWKEPRQGNYVYRCWQRNETSDLVGVWIVRRVGCALPDVSNTTHTVYRFRALIESGVRAAPDVYLPPLPSNAPLCARTGYPGLKLLFQAHAMTRLPDGTPLVPGFLGPWCGLSEWEAKEARHFYRTNKVIGKAGSAGRIHLYRPYGSLTLPQRRRDHDRSTGTDLLTAEADDNLASSLNDQP